MLKLYCKKQIWGDTMKHLLNNTGVKIFLGIILSIILGKEIVYSFISNMNGTDYILKQILAMQITIIILIITFGFIILKNINKQKSFIKNKENQF